MIRKICAIFASLLLTATLAIDASPVIWNDAQSKNAISDGHSRYLLADDSALRDLLAQAPQELYPDRKLEISLPMPGGGMARFHVVESPIMEAGLAADFPWIKTYRLRGIDDPIASGRATMMPSGFSAMLQTSRGRVFIDPDSGAGPGAYLSRLRHGQPSQPFSCGVHEVGGELVERSRLAGATSARLSGNLLSYRIAVSATAEFVAEVGGTVAGAQAEIVKTINRVNQIYERDLGIRLVLVTGNDDLIEDGDSGCLTNDNAFSVLIENQAWIDGIIGNSSYDIGHVFTTDPGGLALIESACNVNIKANGTSGLADPTGEIFYIDFVAHEIGHQLGADHSFNGSTSACSTNRNATTAFEPGSGSSIMAYAGICGSENIQGASDATFHAGSIDQIDAFVSAGGSCFAASANGNNDPSLTGAADFTIPKLTPFVLDNATASDADSGDQLSYQWDQMDAGTLTSSTSFGQDLGDNALFRSYLPSAQSHRDFPALGTQLLGLFDEAEVMACAPRSMNFRLTVRDGASGQVADDQTVTVTGDGPFRVTSQDSAQTIDAGAGAFTVTWDVAGTDTAPINCATVDIDLLTFSDSQYSSYSVHPLLVATANNGSAQVSITPAENSSSRARLRVKCSDNVFYDISDADLVIDGTDPTPILFDDDDIDTAFNANAITFTATAPVCGSPRVPTNLEVASSAPLVNIFPQPGNPLAISHECEIPTQSRGTHDSSSFDLAWLLFVGFMVGAVRLVRAYRKRGAWYG